MLSILSRVLFLASLASTAPLLSSNPALKIPSDLAGDLEERAVCNADNLLRLLRMPSNLPEALPFCSSYLRLPATTVTVATSTPSANAFVTSVETKTDVLSDTTFITTIVDETAFSSVTSTQVLQDVSSVTSTATITVTTTGAPAALTARAVPPPLSQRVTETYDSSRISSACGCLTIPLGTISLTATAPTVTSTSVISLTPETSVTSTETRLLTSTLTSTSVVEVEVTSTTSSTAIALVTVTPVTTTQPVETGFFLRSHRDAPDGYYHGNYMINRDLSAADKRQALTILASNSTAPFLYLTSEGYLAILKSQRVSAAQGTEADTWIAFASATPPANGKGEPILFDKKATVLANTAMKAVTWANDPVPNAYGWAGGPQLVRQDPPNLEYRFIVPTNMGGILVEACGATALTTAFPAMWFGHPGSSCFAMKVRVTTRDNPGPAF